LERYLKKVSESYCYVYNYQSDGISLQYSSGVKQHEALTLSGIAGIDAGSQYTTRFVFTFPIYKGVQYTFSAHINTNTARYHRYKLKKSFLSLFVMILGVLKIILSSTYPY
jgi:hypothetical protein